MHHALDIFEFTSQLCLELFLVVPLIKDNLTTIACSKSVLSSEVPL